MTQTIKILLLTSIFAILYSIFNPVMGQDIVPHRDIQKVDSLNRGKPTTAPVTVIKNGYTIISKADGRFYEQHLGRYIQDSLGIGAVSFDSIVFDALTDTLCFYMAGGGSSCTYFPIAGGDAVFYDYGTTDAPVVTDDSVETTNVKYLLFNGLSGGLASSIEILKESVLRWDHGSQDTDRYVYLLKALPLQQSQSNTSFNITMGSTDQTGDRNDDVVGIGWNVSPGGAPEVTGEPMLGIFFENHYTLSGRYYNEFQLRYTDSLGVVRRPMHFFLDKGNPAYYSAAVALPSFQIEPADDDDPYFDFSNPDGIRSKLKMLDPVSTFGAEITVDPGNNNMQITNQGMTTPTLYMSGFTWAELPKTRIIGSQNTATHIAGRDASGWVSTLPWTTAADSLKANGIGGITFYEIGGTTPPNAISDNMYKSSGSVTLGSSTALTGRFNLIGAMDQSFPSAAYKNIAIGEGVGNASLTGTGNIYIGDYAGIDNLTGTYNIFMGYASGSNYTGSTNIGIGREALMTNISGAGNLAIGDRALRATTGSNNLAMGNQSLQKTIGGTHNTAMGNLSFHENLTGIGNTGIGYQAGYTNQAGHENVFIGYQTGLGGDTDHSNNTAIGSYAGSSIQGNGNVMIGYSAGSSETGSNTLYIDNSSTASPLLKGDFSANTLMINGKLGFTTQGTGAAGLVGYDGSNYLTRPLLGPGLAIEDNALTLTGMGSDSIYTTDTTVCFIILGDTTCVLLDSSYTTDSTYCYIFAGDTTCVEFNPASGNIYTMDGTLTNGRNLNTGNHTFRITRGGVNVLRIPQSGVTASIQFETLSNSDIYPLIQMTNDGTGDNYIHFNDFADEDYSLGVDASEEAFYISGGSALGADPLMYFSHVRDSIVVYKDIQLNALLLDEDGDAGTVGHVATATATGFNWAAPAGGTYTASEGLTMTGSDITLGGTLTSARTITTSSISDYVNFSTSTASVTPLLATATNGSGILASNTSTAGALRGTTTNGYGLHAQSTSGGRAAKFESDPSSTNTVHTMLDIWRRTSSTAADGIGIATEYQIEADNGTLYRSNTLESKWTTAANATRTSQFMISGVNAGSNNDIIYFEGDKRTRFNGRAQTLKGADVSSAGDLTLGVGNVFHITGTTTINAITTTDWQAGSEVTLIFDASVTVKNNTAGGGSTAVMRLGGAADFAATARDVLKLVYDGTEWFEVTRSAN